MNILNEKFIEFQKLPTEERIECFEKDGLLYDMIILSNPKHRWLIRKKVSKVRRLVRIPRCKSKRAHPISPLSRDF